MISYQFPPRLAVFVILLFALVWRETMMMIVPSASSFKFNAFFIFFYILREKIKFCVVRIDSRTEQVRVCSARKIPETKQNYGR